MKLLKRKPAPVADDPLFARVDPRPVKTALEALKWQKDDLIEGTETLKRWKKELEDWLGNVDPNNDSELRTGSVLRDKVELLPRQLKRAEERLAPLVETLIAESKALVQQFNAEAQKESDARLDEIEAILKPHCIDYDNQFGQRINQARSVARSCGVFNCFALPYFTTDLPIEPRETYASGPDAAARADHYDREVMRHAEELLQTFERWKATGGAFLPKQLVDYIPTPERS